MLHIFNFSEKFIIGCFKIFASGVQFIDLKIEHNLSSGLFGLFLVILAKDVIDLVKKILLAFSLCIGNLVEIYSLEGWLGWQGGCLCLFLLGLAGEETAELLLEMFDFLFAH